MTSLSISSWFLFVFFFIYIIRLIVFCIGVYACISVCVLFSRMEKMVSDFKHSKSFCGTFITSRVSTTVLQLVLVSLCFFLSLMASAYSYSVHVSFRYKSLRFQPGQTYSLHLFCCWWFFVFVSTFS